MNPKIESLNETRLIGQKLVMSFANNKTMELWQRFMKRRTEIQNARGTELYSVELYNDPEFFRNFNPMREFEKWAAVEVESFATVPGEMETLLIPAGLYAVFHYKGRPSEARATYQYIFGTWIPNSEFTLDNRPHFAVMGEKYKGEHPESEEDFWIPIKRK